MVNETARAQALEPRHDRGADAREREQTLAERDQPTDDEKLPLLLDAREEHEGRAVDRRPETSPTKRAPKRSISAPASGENNPDPSRCKLNPRATSVAGLPSSCVSGFMKPPKL